MLVAQLFKAVAAEIWAAKIIWAAADLAKVVVDLVKVVAGLVKAVVDLAAADLVVKVVLVMAIMACKTF